MLHTVWARVKLIVFFVRVIVTNRHINSTVALQMSSSHPSVTFYCGLFSLLSVNMVRQTLAGGLTLAVFQVLEASRRMTLTLRIFMYDVKRCYLVPKAVIWVLCDR